MAWVWGGWWCRGQSTLMETAGRERAESDLAGLLGHAHPSPLRASAPETSAPERHVTLVGGAFLGSVFLSRPLQMGQRWKAHHCTLLAPGLGGPGHCAALSLSTNGCIVLPP